MDYHLIFIILSILIFIITLMLLFIEPSVEQTTAALILIMFNIVLCIYCALSFYGINLPGYDSAGTMVANTTHDMETFSFLFVLLFYINVMLTVYCGYLYMRKPWEQLKDELDEDLPSNY